MAAPTAGLHFTAEIFEKLRAKGIQEAQVTLHVSAGTFQPIKAQNILEHPMHSEQIQIGRETVEKLLAQKGKTVAVGTTSVRTLESLFWFGVKLLENKGSEFRIEKLFAYENRSTVPSKEDALQAVLNYMEKKSIGNNPGKYRNFHFPRL